MRSPGIPLVVVLLSSMVALVIALALLPGTSAQTDPPSSGDWKVSDTTLVSNRTVALRGNLTVASGGHLTLRNVTLQVFSGSGITRGIRVESGATLVIEDLDGDAGTSGDRSTVMRGSPSWGYAFEADAGSHLEIRQSLVTGAGLRAGSGGLISRANDTILVNSTFMDGEAFCVMLGGSTGPWVSNSTFAYAGDGMYLRDVEDAHVELCTFWGNSRNGLRLEGVLSSSFDGCNVSSNNRGVAIYGGDGILINGTLVHENPWGIELYGVSNLTFSRCLIDDARYDGLTMEDGCYRIELDRVVIRDVSRSGIDGEDASHLTLRDSLIRNATYFGIRLLNWSVGMSVLNTSIVDNGYTGLHLEGADTLTIRGSNISNNGYHGVFLIQGSRVRIQETAFDGNGYDGLSADNTNVMDIQWCHMEGNGYNGFFLQAGSYDVLVQDATCTGNTRSGIRLDAVSNVGLYRCQLLNNTDLGVRVESDSRDVDMEKVNLAGNANGGVRVTESTSVWLTYSNVNYSQAGSPALYVRASDEVSCNFSVVEGTVRLLDGSNVTFLAPASLGFTPIVDATSRLDLAYYVAVMVLWPDLTPVANATVTATTAIGTLSFLTSTDDEGSTDTFTVTVDRYLETTTVVYTPITFEARKGVEITKNVTNILGNTTVVIILQDLVPPVAVTGDVMAELGFEVTLDGGESHDNGEVVVWSWTFDDGVGTVQLDGRTVNWTFTVLGTFSGRLTVTDSVGLSNGTDFSIQVVDTTPPRAEAGEDLTVDQHQQVVLDGRNSTDNDASLPTTGTFLWRLYKADVLQGELEGMLETHVFDEMGLYRVDLLVTDQSGNGGNDTLWVAVLDITPPLVEVGPDLVVDQHELVTLEPIVLEDNDPTFPSLGTSRWLIGGPDAYLNISGPLVEFVPSLMGKYRVTILVYDPSGNMATDMLRITVRDIEAPMVVAGEDQVVEMGTLVALDGTWSTDNDQDFSEGGRFIWHVVGPRLDRQLNGAVQSFEPPWIGEYNVTLTVTDVAGNSASATFTVTSVDTLLPWFVAHSPGNQTLPHGDVVLSFTMRDVGTGIDPLRVELRVWFFGGGGWSNWSAISLDSGGLLVEARMPMEFPEGRNMVMVRCWDLAGNGPVPLDISVRVNTRPVAVILSPVDGADYGPYDEVMLDAGGSFDVDEEDDLTFTWSSDLDGLLGIGKQLRAPPLTPGTHRITLVVDDGIEGHDVVAQISITVRPEPSTVDDDEFPWLLALAVAIVVVGIAAVLWDHQRRTRRPPELMDEEKGLAEQGPEA